MSRGASSSKVKAVIFDYGEVLVHRPTSAEFGRMAEICGITPDSFYSHWERSRPPYDRGDLTPEIYWSKLAAETKTKLGPEQIEELRKIEIEMWTTENPTMVKWLLTIGSAGIKTGLLSNMPAELAAYVRRRFEWMSSFTFKTFSAEVRLVKPDLAIYEHTLRGLGVEAGETLFVDDRETNIRAARGLGMHAIRFQSVAQFRKDLGELGFALLPGVSE
jgi:putative hydrolase of the HAD superfamily